MSAYLNPELARFIAALAENALAPQPALVCEIRSQLLEDAVAAEEDVSETERT